MKKYIGIGLLAVASLVAACTKPATPQPPVQPTRTLTVWPPQTAPGAFQACQITLKRDNVAQVLMGTTDTAGFGTATWPGTKINNDQGTIDGALNVHIDYVCPNFQPGHTDGVLAATGNQDIFLGGPVTPNDCCQPLVLPASLVPLVAPLPAVPTRDQLANVHALFQGVTVTTSKGTWNSWGPDLWIQGLTDADRAAILAAHKAAGATHIAVAVQCVYSEGRVAYPNAAACNNDFRTDTATLRARLIEIINAGLHPVLFLGGDNGYQFIYNTLPNIVTALRNDPAGDITKYIVPCPGFDSIDPLATNNGTDLDALLVFIRQQFGPNEVIAKENQAGWAFWSGCNGGGAASYQCPGGQSIDVVLQEFAAPPGPPQPAPAVVSGTWDREHNDYAPNWADANRGTAFEQIWQILSRLVSPYHTPADEPFNVMVPGIGGPQDGKLVPVRADSQNNSNYLAGGTPRGRFYIIAFEYNTYDWVRNHVSLQDVIGATNYFLAIGVDNASGPTSSRPKPNHTVIH